MRQVVLISILAAAALLAAYSLLPPATTFERTGELGPYLKGPMARLTVVAEPYDLSDHIVALEDGSPVKLSDMAGKAMLINIWASYCLPCRAEMPELAHLQKELGDQNFEVVAVNVDRGGPKMAREIMEEWNVEGLAVYSDRTSKIAFDLAQGAMPMSLIVDRAGKIRAYYLGALKWDAPEALAFFSALRDGAI